MLDTNVLVTQQGMRPTYLHTRWIYERYRTECQTRKGAYGETIYHKRDKYITRWSESHDRSNTSINSREHYY